MKAILGNMAELKETVARLREAGERIVFTNGRFDLLHVGHVRYLTKAKEFGTVLIVGINSDAAVKKLSGPHRPFTPCAERMEIIAALKPVDYVVEFDALTADELLRVIRPDVYVKGGDYRTKPLPEAETAKEVGAKIELVDLEQGYSTTKIIETIVERCR